MSRLQWSIGLPCLLLVRILSVLLGNSTEFLSAPPNFSNKIIVDDGECPPQRLLLSSHNTRDRNRNNNGGVIVFWHVPKTGGSTLRQRYRRKNYPNLIRWVDMGLKPSNYEKRNLQSYRTFCLPGTITKIVRMERWIHTPPTTFRKISVCSDCWPRLTTRLSLPLPY